MSVILGQPLHGFEGANVLLHELGCCQISKLNRGLPRIEQEAKVGGRKPCSNSSRFFLHIVRDQPVVLRIAEGRVVAPDVQCGATQESLVLLRDMSYAADAAADSTIGLPAC